MLLQTLLCLLLLPALAFSQQLSLNSLSTFSPGNLPNPPQFSLPRSQKLTISIAFCSDFPSTNPPKFTFDNSTNSLVIPINGGKGTWTGSTAQGGTLRFQSVDNVSFEIGVSDNEPFHQTLTDLPLLGDTASNQALIFSPVFLKPPVEQPTYPNYTFPPANLSLPSPPPAAQTPNFTLVLAATSANSLTNLPQIGCRLLAVPRAGTSLNQRSWLREDGWRSQFFVEGLQPSTNYTAYVVQGGTKVSGPIYLATKSASFSCPLVHSVPFCPSISYAVPLPAPPSPATAYEASTLPSNLTQSLIQYMTNFTVTLSTFACGRDAYSPLKTCADCHRAYRTWLCAVSFTRCAEVPPAPPPPTTAQVPLLPAHSPVNASAAPRNANLTAFPSAYTALLPCIETCTAVDRACPSFLKFQCPRLKFGANESYGVGYIDGSNGKEAKGAVGAAVDRWGNVWCNG